MEMLRRRSEKNIRSYSAREKMQEAEEQAKVRMYIFVDRNFDKYEKLSIIFTILPYSNLYLHSHLHFHYIFNLIEAKTIY